MSVHPKDLLRLAKSMSETDDEVSRRACISRAYYSLFHSAFAKAEQCYPDRDQHVKKGSHQRLIDRFLASPQLEARSVGYMLKDMKGARHIADYALGKDVECADVRLQLRTADRALQQMSKLP